MMSAQQQQRPQQQLLQQQKEQQPRRKNVISAKERVSINVRVCARIRPTNAEEREAQNKVAIQPLRKLITKKAKAGGLPLGEQSLASNSSHSRSRRRRSKLIPPTAGNKNNNNASHARVVTANSKTSTATNHGFSSGGEVTSLIAGIENRCRFEFDAVFPSRTKQKEVYDNSVGDIIRQELFRGYNVSIISVGSKSSGKSYTMSGGWKTAAENSSESENSENSAEDNVSIDSDNITMASPEEGILPRVLYDLFKTKKRHESESSVENDGTGVPIKKTTTVTIRMSFIEIADEGIKDVLADSDPTCRNPIVGYQDPSTFEAKKLAWITVESPDQVKSLMGKASQVRAATRNASTVSNNPSHLVCRFHVTKMVATTMDNSDQQDYAPDRIVSRLTVANLAGPDSSNNSSTNRNRATVKDLQALCNSIELLSDDGGDKNPKSSTKARIRSRIRRQNSDSSSILTRVLRSSFGGKYAHIFCLNRRVKCSKNIMFEGA